MGIGNFQIVSVLASFVVITLGVLVGVVATESSVVSQPPVVIDTVNASRLQVQDATGVPGSTSDILQGAPSTQTQDESQIEQPSQQLLQYLQPNSGQSSFNSQSSGVQ